MYLPTLNDDELISYADGTLDPLTSTDLERELLKRFVALLAEKEDYAPVHATLEKYELEDHDVEALAESLVGGPATSALILDTVINYGIDNAHELKTELEIAKQFRHIANDAGDIFTRLHLVTNHV